MAFVRKNKGHIFLLILSESKQKEVLLVNIRIRIYNIYKSFEEMEISMYIIVGLGNPTTKYEHTRHNVGFDVIDELADKFNIDMNILKHKAICGKGVIDKEKVVLVKPMTYMNLSGEAVRSVIDFYKIDHKKELIVIYDDVSLEVGRIRIREKGSAGGHNGIKNIIANLSSEEFIRLKLGVGEKPRGYDLADYVLGHFKGKDKELIEEGIDNSAKATEALVTQGLQVAMNKFNKLQ